MKKLLLILAPAVLMAGCSKELVITPPPAIEEEVTSEIPQRNVENAVYNELTDSWMIPQADPYTLENFQKAYDNLASGKSIQALTRAEASEFSASEKLKPTHYALRIYPKSEEEQWILEMMEDVKVAYAPFNYSGLIEEEIERVPKTRSDIPSPFEVSPYTVTYDNEFVTDGGPTGPVTFQLPILYAVWPVDKPLPDGLEYKKDYDIFLPHETPQTRSAEYMSILETEAVALALGLEALPASPATRASTKFFRGVIRDKDDVLLRDVPMVNIKVRSRQGSRIADTSTDSDGFFYVDSGLPLISSTGVLGMYVDIDCVYQDPSGKWKITNGNTTPLSVSIKQVLLSVPYPAGMFLPPLGGTLHPVVLEDKDRRQANEIHRAANYFFNTQTDFPKPSISGGIKIIANATYKGYDGVTNWYKYYTELPWIEICNNNRTDSEVVGITLHELGHLAHYWHGRTGANANYYQQTLKGLRESFAPYVGWYLGEKYYIALGWTKPTSRALNPLSKDITINSNQDWMKTDRTGPNNYGEYTPLFVDLTDNYNQNIYYSSATPNDAIEGVPASVIWNVISTSTSWAQCRAKLQSYAGTGSGKYYTTTAFNNWIVDFDFWFAQTYNQGL